MTGVIVGLFHKFSSFQYLYTHMHDIYSQELNANVWDIYSVFCYWFNWEYFDIGTSINLEPARQWHFSRWQRINSHYWLSTNPAFELVRYFISDYLETTYITWPSNKIHHNLRALVSRLGQLIFDLICKSLYCMTKIMFVTHITNWVLSTQQDIILCISKTII